MMSADEVADLASCLQRTSDPWRLSFQVVRMAMERCDAAFACLFVVSSDGKAFTAMAAEGRGADRIPLLKPEELAGSEWCLEAVANRWLRKVTGSVARGDESEDGGQVGVLETLQFWVSVPLVVGGHCRGLVTVGGGSSVCTHGEERLGVILSLYSLRVLDGQLSRVCSALRELDGVRTFEEFVRRLLTFLLRDCHLKAVGLALLLPDANTAAVISLSDSGRCLEFDFGKASTLVDTKTYMSTLGSDGGSIYVPNCRDAPPKGKEVRLLNVEREEMGSLLVVPMAKDHLSQVRPKPWSCGCALMSALGEQPSCSACRRTGSAARPSKPGPSYTSGSDLPSTKGPEMSRINGSIALLGFPCVPWVQDSSVEQNLGMHGAKGWANKQLPSQMIGKSSSACALRLQHFRLKGGKNVESIEADQHVASDSSIHQWQSLRVAKPLGHGSPKPEGGQFLGSGEPKPPLPRHGSGAAWVKGFCPPLQRSASDLQSACGNGNSAMMYWPHPKQLSLSQKPFPPFSRRFPVPGTGEQSGGIKFNSSTVSVRESCSKSTPSNACDLKLHQPVCLTGGKHSSEMQNRGSVDSGKDPFGNCPPPGRCNESGACSTSSSIFPALPVQKDSPRMAVGEAEALPTLGLGPASASSSIGGSPGMATCKTGMLSNPQEHSLFRPKPHPKSVFPQKSDSKRGTVNKMVMHAMRPPGPGPKQAPIEWRSKAATERGQASSKTMMSFSQKECRGVHWSKPPPVFKSPCLPAVKAMMRADGKTAKVMPGPGPKQQPFEKMTQSDEPKEIGGTAPCMGGPKPLGGVPTNGALELGLGETPKSLYGVVYLITPTSSAFDEGSCREKAEGLVGLLGHKLHERITADLESEFRCHLERAAEQQQAVAVDPPTSDPFLKNIKKALKGQTLNRRKGVIPMLEVQCVLGKGARGIVFRAKWNGILTAVKMIMHSGAGNFEGDLKVLTEVALATSVSHPNIVRTYASFPTVEFEKLRDACAVDGACPVAEHTASGAGQQDAVLKKDQQLKQHSGERSAGYLGYAAWALTLVQQVFPYCRPAHTENGACEGRAGDPKAAEAVSHDDMSMPRNESNWFDRVLQDQCPNRDLLGSCWAVLVMEQCNLSTLEAAIYGGKFKTPKRGVGPDGVNMEWILLTGLEIANAMDHLQNFHGIVHGDLKPSNILLHTSSADARGFTAKVADFGTSRILAGGEERRALHGGSCAYMPPEVLSSSGLQSVNCFVSRAMDVYSFGIIMWEMYSAEKPYSSSMSSSAVRQQVVQNGLRPMFGRWTPLPFKRLVAGCWHAERQRRPTFETIRQQLEALCREVCLQGRIQSPGQGISD